MASLLTHGQTAEAGLESRPPEAGFHYFKPYPVSVCSLCLGLGLLLRISNLRTSVSKMSECFLLVNGKYILSQRKIVAPTREILAQAIPRANSAFRNGWRLLLPLPHARGCSRSGGTAGVRCLGRVFSSSYAWGSLSTKGRDITETVQVTQGRTG